MVNRFKTWLVLVGVIVVILAIVGIAVSCDSFSPSEALNFTLPTLAGGNVTLSELEGTPVVVNFWSISCYWCRKQLPYLENVAKQSGEGVKVIAINVVDSAARVRHFFGDYEPAMIVALDTDGVVFVNYCQEYRNPRKWVPFTLLIDSQGMVQHRRIGPFSSEAELWNTLKKVLGITIP